VTAEKSWRHFQHSGDKIKPGTGMSGNILRSKAAGGKKWNMDWPCR
jgi:hypothetical protein